MAKPKVDEEGFSVSIGDLFRCLCCPRPKPPEDDVKFKAILTKLGELDTKVNL